MSRNAVMTKMGAALAALLLAAGAQAADVKLPADLPPYAQDKPLPVPQISQHTLANGLQVWVVPRQGLPRVDFVLAVRGAGFAADAPGQPGFASLLAGVLTEGTAQRDSRAIAETAQGLGGAIGAGSSNDGLTVSANACNKSPGRAPSSGAPSSTVSQSALGFCPLAKAAVACCSKRRGAALRERARCTRIRQKGAHGG